MPDTSTNPVIFLSHAPSDTEYAQAVAELLISMGLHDDEIVCSSLAPYSEPLENGVYTWLQENQRPLFVLYLLSHNYYSSASCLNEMGALWAFKSTWLSLLAPGFTFEEMDGVAASVRDGIRLDPKENSRLPDLLDRLCSSMTRLFSLRPMDESSWLRRREAFMQKITSLSDASDKLAFQKLQASEDNAEEVDSRNLTLDACLLLVYAADSPSGLISMSTDLTGITVSIGLIRFNRDESFEEITRWRSAINRLVRLGLANLIDRTEMVYALTPRGRRLAAQARERYQIDTSQHPDTYRLQEAGQ